MACATTKLPQGPATRHVLVSKGPSAYHLNFYSTNYSNNYSKKNAVPPKNFKHKGTGYLANFRPTVYYNKEVDKTQNPKIANLLTDSYETLTSRDYIPPPLKTGAEQLPINLLHGPTGYTHNSPITTAPSIVRLPFDTSYRDEFPCKEFRSDSKHPSSYSGKEETGFTHAYNVEPITYRPNECHLNQLPNHVTWRPTGRSIMKGDFNQTPLMTGNEPMPHLASRDCRVNGFIRGNACPVKAQPMDIKGPYLSELHPQVVETMRKKDPVRLSVVTHPHPYTAYTRITYPRQKIHPITNIEKNSVGQKEMSGYAENTAASVPNRTPLNSLTVFRESFRGDNLVKDPPSGDSPQSLLPDGFTKSTRLHHHGPTPVSEKVLSSQKPYVTRSILARDPCYLDYTYHHKQHDTKARTGSTSADASLRLYNH